MSMKRRIRRLLELDTKLDVVEPMPQSDWSYTNDPISEAKLVCQKPSHQNMERLLLDARAQAIEMTEAATEHELALAECHAEIGRLRRDRTLLMMRNSALQDRLLGIDPTQIVEL